jgi:hypothetical protein
VNWIFVWNPFRCFRNSVSFSRPWGHMTKVSRTYQNQQIGFLTLFSRKMSPYTCNMDLQDQQKTRLDGIHTLHPDSIWLTQPNAGQIQHHKCLSTTKENLRLPSTCQGCVRTKNAGCIQHLMWMWPGLILGT